MVKDAMAGVSNCIPRVPESCYFYTWLLSYTPELNGETASLACGEKVKWRNKFNEVQKGTQSQEPQVNDETWTGTQVGNNDITTTRTHQEAGDTDDVKYTGE